MLKSNSIFRKLLLNNILIIVISIFMIMSCLAYYLCRTYKANEMHLAQGYADKCAYSIKAEISKAVQSTGYVINNQTIIDGLKKNYTNSIHDAYSFSSYITSYLNVLSDDAYMNTMTIYFNNEFIYENRYLQKYQQLDNYKDLLEKLKKNPSEIIWEHNIFTNDYKRVYLTFYRYIPLSDCIIKMNVFIPDYTGSAYNVHLVCAENASSYRKNASYSEINSEFSLVALLNTNILHKNYFYFISTFGILFLVFCSALALLFYSTSKNITSNIEHFLVELESREITSPDYEITFHSNDVYELAVIKRTLEKLINNIKNMTAKQYKDQLEKSRLEFDLQQYKINPHLLYNSLSLINLIAYKRRDFETINVVDSLVDYYRLILIANKEISTIGDEINMLTKYVYINEISQNKKFEFTTDIPSELLKISIPHLLFQPFVENSISHGLAGERDNCKIHIQVHNAEEMIIVNIIDNGFGIDSETLHKLNNIENVKFGYGIRNTYERLCLYYNHNAKIKFTSTIGQNTSVQLQFPIQLYLA